METVGSNAQKVTKKNPVSRQTASAVSSASFSSLLTGETDMSSEAPMRDDINVNLRETPCPFRKSYPRVAMMQSTQDGHSDDGAGPLDCSMQWRVLVQ